MGKKNKYPKQDAEGKNPDQAQQSKNKPQQAQGAPHQAGPSGSQAQAQPIQQQQQQQRGQDERSKHIQGPQQPCETQQKKGAGRGTLTQDQPQLGAWGQQPAVQQQSQSQHQQRGPKQQQGAPGAPVQGQQQQQRGRGPAPTQTPAAQGQQQQSGWVPAAQQSGGRGAPTQTPAAQGQQQQRGWGPAGPQGSGRGAPTQTPAAQGQQQQSGWGPAGQQSGGRGAPPQSGWGPSAQGQQQQRALPQGSGRGTPPQGHQQQQSGRGAPAQSGWGPGAQGQQQQRAPPQGSGRGTPPQGQQQQRTPHHHQGSQGAAVQGQQHYRGPQGGISSQQGQQRGNAPQRLPVEKSFQQLAVSNEQVLAAKEKSCAGVVRGTLGRPGTLEVNYLKLMLDNMPETAYHYDVSITPDRPKKFLRSVFDQCKREKFGTIEAAFDGNKNCYTNMRLPGPIDTTVEVPDSGSRLKQFKIEIKETKDCEVDLGSLRNYHMDRVFDKPMRAIQALDVILSSTNHERGIHVGRSFYCRPNQPYDLEQGYEAWTGLFQAALLGEMPLLNVDIAHKSFPRQSTLLEYLDIMGIKPSYTLDNYAKRDVLQFLKGIDIQYEPPENFGATPKRYRVLDIGEPASRLSFRLDDGNTMTVAAYFRSKGYSLRYPDLNCIKVGSTVKSIHLPMELCSIIGGQPLNRKDGEKQVQKMIRFAATSTNKRKEKIMNILQYFELNNSPIVRAFGIQIGSNFIKVPSRILPAPCMEYLNGKTVKTSRGAWRMDDLQFLITSKPANGHKWAIIYEENKGGRGGISYHDLEAFKKDVLKTSQTLNMNLAADAKIIAYVKNQVEIQLATLSKENTALVFVVLSNYGTSYAKVKQSAELKVGILTQCIKENTVKRTSRDRTVFSNILLKVNAKLNGTNHKISRDDKLANLMEPLNKVMYLGADVTHPSPDQRHIPSVVGVTASHDSLGACYNLQYRLQESKQEHIVDMETIVTHHLKIYHKYQNYYPDSIIYYRDGVSDGQFPIITSVELRAIRNAYKKLVKTNVKLTCIIVVKRHHTRFFPMTQPRDERDFNNVEPGTVVDQHITHPNEVQFFLVSHQSIQGTARPTRYNVIEDDSKFNINFLQKLTYNLCHLFPRCNRSVSYPAPAYLAHLVAFRGRVYLDGSYNFSQNLQSEYNKRLIRPDFMLRNPMYFV